MPRLKVLHVSSDGESIWPFFSAIADHADRDRFDVSFCTLGPAGRLQEEIRRRGLTTTAMNCGSRSQYPAALLRLAARMAAEKIDVVETHLFDASLVGLAAARLSGARLRIFRGHHSHEVFLYPRRSQYFADWLSSRVLSDRVIVHCDAMRDCLAREAGVPAGRMAVLPLPFEIGRWDSPPAKRAAVRARYGLAGKTVFGVVSRLYWVKDQASLLKAFAPVAQRHADIALLVVGTGNDRRALERLAAELGISARVVFAGYCEDVVDVMAAMDVLVHPAVAESFGQVIVEAFALSKPVISTRVGISPELIVDGTNGWLVESQDPDSISRALESMLGRRSDWEAMGRDGRARVSRFAAEKVVPAYEKQYLEWLSR